MSKEIGKKSVIPWLFLVAITIVIGFWGIITPIFEFPDEQVHLETVSYVADYGRIPPQKVDDVTVEMAETQKLLGTFRDGQGNNKYTYHPDYHVEYTTGLIGKYENEIISLNTNNNRNSYVKLEAARYPIGYYLYSSFWLKLVNNADLITRSFVVRLGSLPIVFLMAYFTYKIGLILFGKTKLALTLVLITFSQPMFSFVSAGVNSDNLHNLLFTLLIYFSLKVIKHGLTISSLISMIVISVLDIFTKPQGYLVIPIIVIALIISAVRLRKWKLLGITLILFITLIIATKSVWIGYINLSNSRNAPITSFLSFSANKLIAQNVVWYWGVFKWLGVVLPPIYWRVANRVVVISALGLFVYLWKVIKKKKVITDPYVTGYILLASIIYALAIFWADWQHTKNVGYSLGIQARYFFPTIVAHMTILITGIISLGWNNISRRWLRRTLIILFVWLQIGGIWRIITTYYPGHNLSQLITEASQYKPFFVKGNWWYLWGSVYILSLLYLLKTALLPSTVVKVKPRQK